MAINSFTPNQTIKSSEVNSNFQNLSDNTRWITLQWVFPGTLITQNSIDVKSLPDNVTFERCDIVVETPPTGQAIIVDIERSTDGGATWTTIFTNQSNRPQIATSQRTGNTTTVDVPSGSGNSHLYRAVIDQVGSGTAGANLNIYLKGKYDLS